MKLPALPPTDLARIGETLLIALAGGALFSWAGMPAGLISGSVVATALAALAGRPMQVPPTLTKVIMVTVGIALGSVVTPSTLRGLATYPLSISLLCLCIVGIIVATTSYLHFVHRWDRLSAMLGASPGALAQTIVMAAEMGVDLRGIVVVQTMRILFLTLGIPSGLALFGFASQAERGFPAGPMAPLLELVILVATSAFCALALHRLKFPGGWIFGSMLGSGFLHGTGLIQGHMPWWLTALALTSIGAVTGARFTNTPLRLMLSYFAAGIGSFAVAMTVASSFVLLASQLVDVPVGDIVMAFSPGAQDTMMVLALALHFDPVFVGAHHLARYLIVSLGNPFMARLLREPPPTESPAPAAASKPAGD